MSQNDFTIANASGATVRADINSGLQALASLSSGSSAPGTMFAYQLWADTTLNLLKIRNGTNSAWVTIGTLDTTYLGLGNALAGYLFGLTISNSGGDPTNDMDIATGVASSDDALITDRVMMTLASGLTKRLDAAWAVGTNQGGLDTGSIANATYHVYLIQRPDTGVVDVLYSTNATTPTMPTNYTKKRRIGACIRTGGQLLYVVQKGDVFMIGTPLLDINATNPGTSAVTRTLTVPDGVSVRALLTVLIGAHATNSAAYISDLSMTDVAVTLANGNVVQPAAGYNYASAPVTVKTSTNRTVRSRVSASDASTLLYLITNGWIDDRGRISQGGA